MNERHLEKIQKCLELANSSNANEAASALKMAQKLMRKYGMSEEDIDFAQVGETTTRSVVQKRPSLHNTKLVGKIAEMFRVSPLHLTEGNGKCRIIFVGQKNQAMLAAYAFDVLFRQLAKARKEFLKGIDSRIQRSRKSRFADSFCVGWVNEACDKILTTPLTEEEQTLFQRYAEKKDNHTDEEVEYRKPKGNYSAEAMRMGREAAKDVHLNTPMDGAETAKLAHSA
jgi:hypothetical protein